MSQIDMELLYEPKEKVDIDESIDEMDEIMSQIGMESLYEEKFDIDEGGVPQELLDRYEVAMNGIDDDMIVQMNEEEDTEIQPDLSPELLQEYQKAMNTILPKKYTDRYQQAYDVFRKWQKSHRTASLQEKVIMAYFSEGSSKYKPSTLWSIYSMLKKTLTVKHNVERHSKQSLVFTQEELKRFILDAPNVSYLAMKVVFIFGVVGVCRGDELTNLTIGNVKDDGNEISVHVPMTKTKEPKDYIICGEMAKIIREYTKLRPKNAKIERMLMQYRKGKCVNQVMGKHSIAKVPKAIATFFNLPDPNLYTGHSYRRTGTTIAADAGASVEDLMRLGPWKSITVCQRYIQDSKTNKRKLANLISGAIDLPSTSHSSTNNSGKRSKPDTLFALDETSNKNVLGSYDAPIDPLSETTTSDIGEMSSGSHTIKLNSGALKSLSETLKGLGVQTGRDKENVILHFGSECKNFTIINLN